MPFGSLDSACGTSLERWGVPGAVVGVLDGEETDVAAYGVADLRTGEPVRADTTFRVASITKPFTATLAVLLADEGLVALDEPVELELPNEGVTLAHLLSHTGGFAGEAGDLARFGTDDVALARVVAELPRQRRLVAPGEAWSYCNAGWWAAGLVCARAARTTYEEALRARVLAPLGLDATGFGEPESRGHNQPRPGDPVHEPAPPVPYPRARRPGGGLVSTAEDLLRFAAFHLDDPRVAGMRESRATTPAGAYGLGWFSERVGGADVWSHLGTYGGFQTLLALVPDRRGAFVILTNGLAGDAVRREVADAILAERWGVRREPAATAELSPPELEALAGSYRSPELDASVAVGGPGLRLDLVEHDWAGGHAALPPLEARPVGGRTFALVGGQWDGERFDFLPAEGPPRFARIGLMLVPRC
jgi:CubicO group peptidase (beta-lactamase class C family)